MIKSDNVKITKYKDIFVKRYTPSWSEEGFVIIKAVSRAYIIEDLNEEETVGTFYKKKLLKTN